MLPPPKLQNIGEEFQKSMAQSLKDHPQLQKQLNQAYDLGQKDQQEELENVLHFAHDIGFYAPALTIASSWPGETYVYHFNEGNPWEGKWKGRSTHILDIAFLLQNYNDHLSAEQRASAVKFGEHVIDFVCGKKPYPAYKENEGGAIVYGLGQAGKTEFVRSTKAEDYGRRGTIFELAKEADLDTLKSVWDGFLRGR